MAARPNKLLWIITKVGDGAEHSDDAGKDTLAVMLDQAGQFPAVGDLLQRVGKQAKPLGRSLLVKQDIKGRFLHDGREYADLAGEVVLADIELKTR